MITVTLETLDKSFRSLTEVSKIVKKGKLAYRLGRLTADAKKEMELFGEHLKNTAIAYNAKEDAAGNWSFEKEQEDDLRAFRLAMEDFKKSHECELWGKPEFFTESEFEPFELSAEHISDLLWLIGDSSEDVGKTKAQAASA